MQIFCCTDATLGDHRPIANGHASDLGLTGNHRLAQARGSLMWTKLRGFRSEKSLKNKGLMTFVGFVYVGNVDEDSIRPVNPS